jgi:hypothetical protein
MQATESRTTKQLFRQWRSGDAESGQVMAQRFADWYYAICTGALGETDGAGPCREACQRFGAGIVSVSDPNQLVPWAHQVVAEEMDKVGPPATDGNVASAYTADQLPKDLLVEARDTLGAEVDALENSYRGEDANVDPIGVLSARYALKRWLREHGLPFSVTPDDPDLDRAPLPAYEANQLDDHARRRFEYWMLSSPDVCQDIAEWAPFAIALRGGLPARPATLSTAGGLPWGLVVLLGLLVGGSIGLFMWLNG